MVDQLEQVIRRRGDTKKDENDGRKKQVQEFVNHEFFHDDDSPTEAICTDKKAPDVDYIKSCKYGKNLSGNDELAAERVDFGLDSSHHSLNVTGHSDNNGYLILVYM